MGQRAFRVVAVVLGLALVAVVGGVVALSTGRSIPWISSGDTTDSAASGMWTVPAGAVSDELTQPVVLPATDSCPGGTFMAPATATTTVGATPGNAALALADKTFLLVVTAGTMDQVGDAAARAEKVGEGQKVPVVERPQAYTIGDKSGMRYEISTGAHTVSDWHFDIGQCGFVIGVLTEGPPDPNLLATAANVVASFQTT